MATAERSRTYDHVAAVVGSDGELLDVALPFVERGLAAGDLVVLSCPPETVELVSAALGAAAGAVEVDPRLGLRGVRSPDAVALTDRHAGRAAATGSGRLRVLGQVDFGRHPRRWREAERYESAMNDVLAGVPLTALCLYDRRVLPEQAVTRARSTHPTICGSNGPEASPDYREPREHLRGMPVLHEAVEAREPVVAVDDASALAPLRRRLGAALSALVPDPRQTEDLHLALSEIAANAFRHGRRPVTARLWVGNGRIVCTITDRGHGFDDPLAGFRPAHGHDLGQGGMGLWLARKLWDSVDLVLGAEGLTVRLASELRRPAGTGSA